MKNIKQKPISVQKPVSVKHNSQADSSGFEFDMGEEYEPEAGFEKY